MNIRISQFLKLKAHSETVFNCDSTRYRVRLKMKWELYLSLFSSRYSSSCSLFWRIPLRCCGHVFFQRCLKPVTCTYIIVRFFLIGLLFWLKYFLLRKAHFSIMSYRDVTIKIRIRCWSENAVPIFSDLSSYGTALAVGGRHRLDTYYRVMQQACGCYWCRQSSDGFQTSNTHKKFITLITVPLASVNTAW